VVDSFFGDLNWLFPALKASAYWSGLSFGSGGKAAPLDFFSLVEESCVVDSVLFCEKPVYS